ncbi:hypothetical protein T4B_322 [Trichinella pseudospiralis]|uniref:Uncharacterized protein n=1 Tax=Trichinella pseudospiralis TaxID=6337 RepID=A0A0V1GG81_TRIPS|nr:hypothetical protein T4B_322 [Trichinella pseudospiralis]
MSLWEGVKAISEFSNTPHFMNLTVVSLLCK